MAKLKKTSFQFLLFSFFCKCAYVDACLNIIKYMPAHACVCVSFYTLYNILSSLLGFTDFGLFNVKCFLPFFLRVVWDFKKQTKLHH